jgi:hypothetical protein
VTSTALVGERAAPAEASKTPRPHHRILVNATFQWAVGAYPVSLAVRFLEARDPSNLFNRPAEAGDGESSFHLPTQIQGGRFTSAMSVATRLTLLA